MVPISKEKLMNFMPSISCSPYRRCQPSKTSWQQKDASGISFQHNTTFGGLWEVAVKSIKHHLRRTLGSHVATYEELCTLLSEIDAFANSRTLCALSDDPSIRTYLSTGHFLIGEPITQLPAVYLTNFNTNRFSRWQT